MTGIYCIVNLINNKFYIGSALNIKQRRLMHLHDLRHGVHANSRLQRAYNKYGEENFEFLILVSDLQPDELVQTEQTWMDFLKPEYNICLVAYSCLGIKRSEETKKKISLAKKGNKSSVGRKYSVKTIQKMSDSAKGRPSPQKGKKLSSEHRANIGKSSSRPDRVAILVARNKAQAGTRIKWNKGLQSTHCPKGHERIPENLYGHTCKICHKEKGALNYRRKKERLSKP